MFMMFALLAALSFKATIIDENNRDKWLAPQDGDA